MSLGGLLELGKLLLVLVLTLELEVARERVEGEQVGLGEVGLWRVQMATSYRGEDEKQDGDQHQGYGIRPDDATNLDGEVGRVAKGTGGGWRAG